jgi:hypothetical protein
MIRYLRNRVYSLIVGTQEDAVEINDLQMKFTVTKTSNNKEKKNQARVEIYNLSEERQKALEDKYVTVQLKVGYADALTEEEELLTLFSGQVVDLKVQQEGSYLTSRSGTDIVTTLTVDEYFKELNGRMVSKTVPAGKTIKDVILALVEDMPEVTRYELNGDGIKREAPDGFPMSGTPRQILDSLTKTYNIEWQIDQSVLYVSDLDGTFSDNTEGVPLIGEFSGLVDRPEYKSEDPKRLRLKGDEGKKRGKGESKNTKQKIQTIHLKVLLNPAITAGSVVKVEWGDIDGYFKVNEVTHSGGFRDTEWYSKLILSAKPV